MPDQEYLKITVEEIQHETADALMCIIDGEIKWIPKSQIEEPDQFQVGDSDVEIPITEWLCEQEGLNEG